MQLNGCTAHTLQTGEHPAGVPNKDATFPPFHLAASVASIVQSLVANLPLLAIYKLSAHSVTTAEAASNMTRM